MAPTTRSRSPRLLTSSAATTASASGSASSACADRGGRATAAHSRYGSPIGCRDMPAGWASHLLSKVPTRLPTPVSRRVPAGFPPGPPPRYPPPWLSPWPSPWVRRRLGWEVGGEVSRGRQLGRRRGGEAAVTSAGLCGHDRGAHDPGAPAGRSLRPTMAQPRRSSNGAHWGHSSGAIASSRNSSPPARATTGQLLRANIGRVRHKSGHPVQILATGGERVEDVGRSVVGQIGS
jgi:hypothetical protein